MFDSQYICLLKYSVIVLETQNVCYANIQKIHIDSTIMMVFIRNSLSSSSFKNGHEHFLVRVSKINRYFF